MNNYLTTLFDHSYISFDLFDSLVRRTMRPEEVFDYTQRKLVQKYGNKFLDYSNKRKKAAVRARSLGKREATLDDIYSFIEYDEEANTIAKNEEIQAEVEVSRSIGIVKAVVEKLYSANKQIIITSDMYLPEGAIRKILEKNEIPFHRIFVSSETQKRKSTGEMYDYIIEQLHIKKTDLIHLGDNYRSDFLIPTLKGIKAIHWKDSFADRYSFLSRSASDESKKLFNLIIHDPNNQYYVQIGYELFGPLLLGLCGWIHSRIKSEKLDGVCFLARDGQIIQKAYNILFPGEYAYLYASRRSLSVPLLKNALNTEQIFNTISYIRSEEPTKDLLQKIGVESNCVLKKVEETFGKTIKRDSIRGQYSEEFYDIIKDEMHQNAKIESEAAEQFLKHNLPEGTIGVVDIGYAGTMQRCLSVLCKSFNIPVKLFGLYLGLRENENSPIEADGYVYNNKHVFNERLIDGFNGLLELFFTADHGSAIRYEKTLKGQVECRLSDVVGEYSEFVYQVQEGAIQFVKHAVDENISPEIPAEVVFPPFEDLLANPTPLECNLLGQQCFYDVFYRPIIAKPKTRSVKDLKKAFFESSWRIGFIKEFISPFHAKELYLLLLKHFVK